jgi:hypothetical protein
MFASDAELGAFPTTWETPIVATPLRTSAAAISSGPRRGRSDAGGAGARSGSVAGAVDVTWERAGEVSAADAGEG